MNQLPQSIPEILGQALELPETERSAYLAAVCEGDERVRQRVERLLAAVPKAAQFLEPPSADCSPTIDRGSSQTIGTLIGPYKLLEPIGEGGMGVVYVAEQTEPVRRRVALKIIKPGMDTKQVIARFEAERQALAMMDHHHIARVLDAGTTDAGRPYFVMELVRGLPITEYCDKARLSPRQRLELFIDVCHAVQHAHQKGVIHRDLKPSNVMITVHDGRPVAKVIDFGVAKAVGQQLTERTVYTAHTQLVGTPLYMSPEQADFSSQDVDTRSDVYSLGVLLYELLTGQTPFDKEMLTKAGFDEMRRIIREDEPPCPSRRFSTLSAQAISTVSQHRSVDERHLGRVLRGELDWIVMKALEKDRSRRYESASALATDIQRYLSDEPVLACPPTNMYRFQKFARKHKPTLVTAVAIAACLILGTTVSAWQAARATTAEAQAQANEQRAVANEQKANANAAQAQAKAREATTQRDEAQKQRDEVQRQRDEIKALSDKLLTTQNDLQHSLYAAHINLAQRAWDDADVPRVLNLLNQHRPKQAKTDLRGFEWHYLNRLCQADAPLSLKRQAEVYGIVGSAAYSPDGKRLLIFTGATTFTGPSGTAVTRGKLAPREAELTVWDAQTGQELRTFNLNGGGRTAVFSSDATRLASASDTEKTVKVWDTETGQELHSLQASDNSAYGRYSVVFSPDGKRLASLSRGEWKVWDAQTGQELPALKCAGAIVAFSPDGKRLATGSGTWDAAKNAFVAGEVQVRDAQTGQELLTLKGHADGVREVTFSPDSNRLVSVSRFSAPAEVKVWDAQTGEELLGLKEQGDGFNTIAFSPDGKRFATDAGNSIKVWDAQTGQVTLSLQGHTSSVRGLAFSPDSQRLASSSSDQTLRVWDLQSGKETNMLKGLPATPFINNRKFFSPDGSRLAIVNSMEVKIWEWNAQKKPDPQKLSLKGISRQSSMSTGDTAVVFSPDFSRLAGISFKTVKLFDARDGQETRTFEGHTNNVMCVAFSPDGKRLASGDGIRSNAAFNSTGKEVPGVVKVWDVETGDELFSFPGHASCVLKVALSPDGKHVASVSEDQVVKVWDTQTGQELHSLSAKGPRTSLFPGVSFSPDGKRLASAGKVWNVQSGEELLAIGGGFTGLTFSPDGKRMTTTGGVVRVLDAQTGELVFSIRDNSGIVAFSPDGKRLASAGKVWDAYNGQELLSFKTAEDIGGSVAFSPDGHGLGIASAFGGQVTIYDATPLPEKP